MDNALKNLTLGKVAYICRIERFQIDAIKIERTQIHFFVMFSLPSSSSMLKVPLKRERQPPGRKLKVVSLGPITCQVIVNAAKKSYEAIKGVNSKGFMTKAILFYTESING